MTLSELAGAFLTANKNRLSPNTLCAYGYDLGLLEREFPDVPTEEVTVAHLRAHRLQAEDLGALTPLFYLHVHPYGWFDLDLTKRLSIELPLGA